MTKSGRKFYEYETMKPRKNYYVYITASERNGTLYIGVTSRIKKRITEHKEGFVDGFTKKYKVDKLVHCETFNNPRDAIMREKQLKKWKRKWKLELIEKENPSWRDLYDDLF